MSRYSTKLFAIRLKKSHKCDSLLQNIFNQREILRFPNIEVHSQAKDLNKHSRK